MRNFSTSSVLPLVSKRFSVKGKFIYEGEQKFYVKGVTYGTFKPTDDGSQFPSAEIIEKDFLLMSQHGINTVRTYTVPPLYLLDIAQQHNIKVMAGLPWEQHITFLDSKEGMERILQGVKKAVNSCSKHSAILCFAVGNEIPAPIVRWYGPKKVEKFIYSLFKTVKEEDPDALVTYVNYPTTEYLSLPFLDFDCFNVYLESKEKLQVYLQRLHNLIGDRPLVLAEIGLDSMRNGLMKQAETLDWQLNTIFAKGCAGAFVFAWTDEWWRGGFDIEDWDFGLVDRNRNFKPALYAVAKAYSEIPFSNKTKLPFISVLVCSHNGSSTIRDTMESLLVLDYPNYEVIVVNDGSTDNLAEIVAEYPFRLINTVNNGLSTARNIAMINAVGEIVAYIDDDAYPDPQWLRYLAYAYHTSSHSAIGGPNIAPDDDGNIATCVANAPGGPVHVLINDEVAEHIPGCNMSFKRDVLLEIGGFDPVYRSAGDDVDICWRIQHTGRTIGFHPAALVWHHRRNSVKTYWKQQKGYGKAEALLEAKWPEKYNCFGHLTWTGRIYGNGLTLPIKLKKDKVFHGVWGSAPFQSIYQQAPGFISFIPLMPEWYLFVIFTGLLSSLGAFWTPMLLLIPVFLLSISLIVVQASISASKSLKVKKFKNDKEYLKFWALTTFLHVIQPLARLYGRIIHGLSPWRKRNSNAYKPTSLINNVQLSTLWSEKWKAMETWLQEMEINLIKSKIRFRRGGHFERWDFLVSCGLFSSCRALLTVEDHGAGKQLLRLKCFASYTLSGIVLFSILCTASLLAFLVGHNIVGSIFAFIALMFIITILDGKAKAMHELLIAFNSLSTIETTASSQPEVETVKEKNQDNEKVFNTEPTTISAVMSDSILINNDARINDYRLKRIFNPIIENDEEVKVS